MRGCSDTNQDLIRRLKMKAKKYCINLTVIFFMLSIFSSIAAAKEKTGMPVLSTGLENQTGIAITIYNVNLGLVKDQREINLMEGTQELRFMDIASQVIPTSVHIKSLIKPESRYLNRTTNMIC